ncbi:MAG: hypothetical protein LQ347_007007 [Umbilicaria vellea]|nr:MAG: hypothetical protein LQ347_007007 [Umbilicaria vellea]
MAHIIDRSPPPEAPPRLQTRILPVSATRMGHIIFHSPSNSFLDGWDLEVDKATPDGAHLLEAASQLRDTDIPIAFPTETVYGLGADATRSSAVQGIYRAKQRPSDNPLIVHICSLAQLRSLLCPPDSTTSAAPSAQHSQRSSSTTDPIPAVYHSLIQRFWPGPLTILLRLPTPSPLAPEVTGSLNTFGARMPSAPLALALIKLADRPLAAPSANASTKPSPTTAEHVFHDLQGRIEIILDGGPCGVGVESTVVDGLCDPPAVLRPGGIGIELLRQCRGWEHVVVAYKDSSQRGDQAPRAPGMKYKHYSPRARVVLLEGGSAEPGWEVAKSYLGERQSVGLVRTRKWKAFAGTCDSDVGLTGPITTNGAASTSSDSTVTNGTYLHGRDRAESTQVPQALYSRFEPGQDGGGCDIWSIGLGGKVADIAHGLFSALRELDQKDVDVIFVEGINDNEGETAAAVMNRLRKAAEVELKP